MAAKTERELQIEQQLLRRDKNCLSGLTNEDWQRLAGKVLAIDPKSEAILGEFSSRAEFESSSFADQMVELFTIPTRHALGIK